MAGSHTVSRIAIKPGVFEEWSFKHILTAKEFQVRSGQRHHYIRSVAPVVHLYTLSLCRPSNWRRLVPKLSAVHAKSLHSSCCILRVTFAKKWPDRFRLRGDYVISGKTPNDSSTKSSLQQLNLLPLIGMETLYVSKIRRMLHLNSYTASWPFKRSYEVTDLRRPPTYVNWINSDFVRFLEVLRSDMGFIFT